MCSRRNRVGGRVGDGMRAVETQHPPRDRHRAGDATPLGDVGLHDADRTDYAFRLAKDGRYEEALALLDTLEKPNTAKALNYRGYATRKLGRTDEGINYYLQSVKLDPQYAQVREYLGEAYVTKGRLDLAQEQLQLIQSICGNTCEEYRDLAEAIQGASNT